MLTSYNGHAITYDELGNPLTYYNGNNYTFTWRGRQMTSLTKDGVTYNFEYDDSGKKIREIKSNGNVTNYYYSGDRLIAEICNEEYLIVYLYDENGSPIGFQYHDTGLGEEGWVTLWYEKNLQGDVVALYNDSGVKLATYTYDAYGNCSATYIKTNNWLIDTLATQNPIRYRGYYYDFELELYCLGTRCYDSITGRFLNPDSVDYLGANGDLNSYNLYAYCSNNPIMYVDPNGQFILSALLIGAAIGGLIGFAGTTYADYEDDGKVFNGSVNTSGYIANTLVGGVGGAAVTYIAPYISSAMAAPVVFSGETVAVSGATVAVAATATTLMFASDHRPKNNKKQNEQFKAAMRELNITDKSKMRRVHDKIKGRNLGYKQLVEYIKEVLTIK